MIITLKGANFSASNIGKISDSTNISAQFSFTASGAINYETGTEKTGSGGTVVDSNWLHSDYVDISEYTTLTLTLPCSTVATTKVGCAFYDENKIYISGVQASKAADFTPISRNLEVPSTAKYIRTSWGSSSWNTAWDSFVFECYGEV